MVAGGCWAFTKTARAGGRRFEKSGVGNPTGRNDGLRGEQAFQPIGGILLQIWRRCCDGSKIDASFDCNSQQPSARLGVYRLGGPAFVRSKPEPILAARHGPQPLPA
jgi:hypothetical protein